VNRTDLARSKNIHAPVRPHGRDDRKEDDRNNDVGEDRSRHRGHQAIGVQLSIMYTLTEAGRHRAGYRTYASVFES
jgi:hypothetical protein